MAAKGSVARIGRKLKKGNAPSLRELSKEARKLIKRAESKPLSKVEVKKLKDDAKAAARPKRRRRTLKKKLSRATMASTSGAVLMYLFDPQLGKQRRERMAGAKEKFLASR